MENFSSIIIFVLSAAAADLYIASRLLYGLSLERKAPAFLQRVNGGVPWVSLVCCTVFLFFAFLNYVKRPKEGTQTNEFSLA